MELFSPRAPVLSSTDLHPTTSTSSLSLLAVTTLFFRQPNLICWNSIPVLGVWTMLACLFLCTTYSNWMHLPDPPHIAS